MGPHPQYGWDFPGKKFGKNSGKTPETLSKGGNVACNRQNILSYGDIWGDLISTAPVRLGLSGGKFREKFGKDPGNALRAFPGSFPSRVRLGCPKPCNSRHLKAPEHFQNSLPPQYGWGRLFFQKWFRRGPLRAGHATPSSTGGVSERRVFGFNVSIGQDICCTGLAGRNSFA